MLNISKNNMFHVKHKSKSQQENERIKQLLRGLKNDHK